MLHAVLAFIEFFKLTNPYDIGCYHSLLMGEALLFVLENVLA